MDYIVPVILTLVVMYACYLILRSWTSDYVIVDSIKDGKKHDVYQNKLPMSVNRPAGIEFSYTGWFRIDDFSDRIGVQKVIFVKGSADLNTACPALVIDANTNTLLVKVDTYGAQETIPIVSVPSKKWLHVAIVVGQDFVDVYINGILYTHHILTQLPKQNSANLLTSPDGGFSGRIVRLKYHPQALTTGDVLSMARERPPTGDETNQSFPPYFDESWFTLRG
jgi:hypothetical protein